MGQYAFRLLLDEYVWMVFGHGVCLSYFCCDLVVFVYGRMDL